MSLLLTGYTGNVGSALVRALTGEEIVALVRVAPESQPPANVRFACGALHEVGQIDPADVETIVHAAADVTFRAPLAQLRSTNVDGTQAMLDFAGRCPRLRRFIHISTVCVSGATPGVIREQPIADAPQFLNAYEQTKWEAERLVLASHLPCEVVRLSIVVADDHSGNVHRLGALHHLIFWLWRALIPLIPSSPETRVDFISADFAAEIIGGLLREPCQPGRIVHAAAGDAAAPLAEVLDLVFEEFADHHDGWRRGVLERPALADAKTWRLFADSAALSRDALFARVIADAQSFLPMLLHPRVYESRSGAPDWNPMVRNTVRHLIHTNWHRT